MMEDIARLVDKFETRLERLETLDQPGAALLYQTELTVAAASIDIQNIAQNYKHLELRIYARGDTAATNTPILLRFNNDSGGNYDRQSLAGVAASASASEVFAQTSINLGSMPAASAAANLFGQIDVSINNYSGTTGNKALRANLARQDGYSAGLLVSQQVMGGWRSNAPITRITVLPSAGNFDVGSYFGLYGSP